MIKRALLVGINAYPSSPLRGCLNDVQQIHDLLTGTYGFASEDITILRDGEATLSGIERGLAWLAEAEPGSDAGDVRVFHYSGHGSYVADMSGDEPDGTDECLVPIDHRTSGMLIDDRLTELYAKIPAGSNLTLLMDCCHSGTNQRAPEMDVVFRFLPVPDDELDRVALARERYEEKHEEEREAYILSKLREARALDEDELKSKVRGLIRAFESRRVGDVNNREGNILLAGCKDIQTSADAYISGDYHGAFTYYLIDSLKSLGATATYRQVASALASRLKQNGYSQIPQLEGKSANKDIPIFSAFKA